MNRFINLSKKTTEIYPLIGAVGFAVSASIYMGTRHIFQNPDVKINPADRNNPVRDITDKNERENKGNQYKSNGFFSSLAKYGPYYQENEKN